jgi:hypothetical protein
MQVKHLPASRSHEPDTVLARVIWIVVLGALAEIGWLAVWLLSAGLSHSAAFTQAYLDAQPLARTLLESLRTAAGRVVAGLPDAPLAAAPGDDRLVVPAIALAGAFVWLAMVYLVLLVVLHRRAEAQPRAIGAVLACSLVFQVTLLTLPGLFSQDVFSYVVYGRIADGYGLNPYVWPPSAVAKDPLVAWVADVWRTYPCPYGPMWVDVQSGVARAFGDLQPVEQAFAYRLLASTLFLASLGLVGRGLGRVVSLTRAERLTALAALAWNPLVLLELIGSAHNDGLMVAASLVAVMALVAINLERRLERRFGLDHVAAGVGFTLGALVKYLSGLGLIWVLVAAAARARTWRARVAHLSLVGLVSAAVMLTVSAPWLELPDSLDPLINETAGVGYVNALPDHLTLAVADRVSISLGAPEPDARDTARAIERLLVFGLFGLVLASDFRRVWREPTPRSIVRATARSSLVFILVVSSSLQPWYFALPLGLAVLLGWHDRLARVVVGYSVLALPALYLAYYLRDGTPEVVYVIYALVPLLPLVPWPPAWHPVAARRRLAPLLAGSFWGLRAE